MSDVTIIVPVFNEHEAVEKVYRDLQETLKNQPFTSEVIFVNDASTDGSAEVLERLGARFVTHLQNRGYGAALKTGAKHATSTYLCFMDCDHTYRAKDIPRLMALASQYPMAVGARDIRLNPRLYIFTKTFICGLLRFLFHQPVEDINSGLRIIRKDLFHHYEPILCDAFSLTSSLTFAFLLDGLSIRYIPIQYEKRMGPSKIRRLSFLVNFIKSYIAVYRFHRKNLRLKKDRDASQAA